MGPEPVGGGEVKLGMEFSVIRLSRQCSWGKTHVSSILQAGHDFGRKLIRRNARVRVRHVDCSYRNLCPPGRYLCESKGPARVSVDAREKGGGNRLLRLWGIDDDKCPKIGDPAKPVTSLGRPRWLKPTTPTHYSI